MVGGSLPKSKSFLDIGRAAVESGFYRNTVSVNTSVCVCYSHELEESYSYTCTHRHTHLLTVSTRPKLGVHELHGRIHPN